MKNNLLKSTALIVVLAMLLTGCAIGESYTRPEIKMPERWDSETDAGGQAKLSVDWWKQFASTELNDLMRQALAANHDLGAAVIRIRQARASASIANANVYPTVDVSLDANRIRGSGTLTAAYEIDLWGKNAAEREAARAKVNYSVYDHTAVALVLQADVASNYFESLALKERIAIARQNLVAAREILRLVEIRFRKGADTALEVSQQRTAVLTMEAQIPQLEQELRISLSALAVLLGKTPQGFAIKNESLAGLKIPAIAGYLPPELMERRPDIRKAEANLIAGNADLKAARAALYPSLNLTASSVVTGIFSSGSSSVTTLATSLAQSIFDGGKLQSQAEKYDAIKAELVEQFLHAVLTGLKEVQDGYGQVSSSTSRQSIKSQAAQEAQETYRIASAKYQAGSVNMLTLLDSQRTKLEADDSRIQADQARFTAMVKLYKSLGGGWDSGNVNSLIR